MEYSVVGSLFRLPVSGFISRRICWFCSRLGRRFFGRRLACRGLLGRCGSSFGCWLGGFGILELLMDNGPVEGQQCARNDLVLTIDVQ